jgi:hypothetical protein
MHAMTVLFERTASPREIAEELGEPVNNVTYHVKRLLALGCVELVDVRPVRGGRVVEHFYRAAIQLIFDEETWQRFGDREKSNVTTGIIRMMSQDLSEAMLQGTFLDPDDNHLSRTPLTLDLEGWEEVKLLLKDAMEGLMGIQDRVVERRGQSDGDDEDEVLHARVHIVQFRSPSPKRAERD